MNNKKDKCDLILEQMTRLCAKFDKMDEKVFAKIQEMDYRLRRLEEEFANLKAEANYHGWNVYKKVKN